MLIAFLSHPQARDSGDYRHRIAYPAHALGQLAHVVDIQTSHPDAWSWALRADVTIITMVADANLQHLIARRKALHKVTVFEISDDFEAFPTHLPIANFYKQPHIQKILRTLAQQSDALQFSSHGLQAKFAYLNPCHRVLPNQWPGSLQLSPPRQLPSRGVTTIGWAGSGGHTQDAHVVAQAWKRWQEEHPDTAVRMRVMCNASLQAIFHSYGLAIDCAAPANFEQYLDFLSSLDIGFALLHDEPFARGRSDGKFLEYASQGVPCIASQCSEYRYGITHGHNGMLAQTTADASAQLQHLLQNPALVSRMGDNARQTLESQRTHPLHAPVRLDFYNTLLAQVGATSSKNTGTGWSSLQTPAEAALLRAMQLQSNQQLDAAMQAYAALIEQHPQFHMLWERVAEIADAKGQDDDARAFIETAIEQRDLLLSAATR